MSITFHLFIHLRVQRRFRVLLASVNRFYCSRLELRNLMTRPELFIRKTDFNATVRMPHVSDIMHPHFRVSQKSPHLATDELLQQYINETTYNDYFINLSPYINDSGVCVPQHFSLHRAYILFRTLGLRHMTVVSHTNQASAP
jgi:hypothetical protein